MTQGRVPLRFRPSARRLVALAVALAAAGCAAHRPPIPARPFPGYAGRVESLSTPDSGALSGVRIAIDPGHGGVFRGVVGAHGLAEAEVNLGVALRLRDLLVAHGAVVLLTRDADRDFLTPGDSTLRADLAERVRIANAFRPDLFLSIHHNAEPTGRRDVNETQTYYKLGDEGPSLDAALDLHRALKRNVGIERDKILPGNYAVLRGSDAPAVLTETSHLSDPDVEALLARPEKQQIEAEALYLGLARSFARPRPSIVSFAVLDAAGTPDTLVTDAAAARLEATIRGEFDEATLLLDGAERTLERTGATLVHRPRAPLAAGRHEAVLTARLAGVGAARAARIAFTVSRPPERFAIAVQEGVMPGSLQGVAAVRIVALDRFDAPSPDSLVLRLRRLAGREVEPAETLVVVRDGVAWAYLRARAGAPPRREAARYRVETLGGPAGRAVRPAEFALAPVPSQRPGVRPGIGSHDWACFALRMPEGVPLADAPGTREPEPALEWLNRDGFARIGLDTLGRVSVPAPAGFRVWPGEAPLPPRFVPLAGGALLGRRIALDPEGGADDAGGRGPRGTRAANLNLEAARMLAGYLRAAGAEVLLTRSGEAALTEIERVQEAEAFRPDRYLRIGHRAQPPRAGYYFSSAAGKRWAGRVAATLGAGGLPVPGVSEDAQYALQQTSCTSLFVSPARVDSDEVRLLAPGTLRAEAYALYLALAGEWAADSAWAADSIEVRDASDHPLPGVPVRIGGLLFETDPAGRVRFARTEAGPVEVEVAFREAVLREVLLDSARGVVLTGPPSR